MACATNEMKIGAALLAYAQDYDDRFPLAGYARVVPPAPFPVGWANTPTTSGSSDPGLLSPYVKSAAVFHCPAVDWTASLTYRYNDLAANVAVKDFADASQTVLVMDGEAMDCNVGHAYAPGALTTVGASVNLDGKVDAGKGATISAAATQHEGGANYVFADGHVRWFAPGAVYFPPQNSASRYAHDLKTRKATGPQPGGAMTFNGKTYAATFHVR